MYTKSGIHLGHPVADRQDTSEILRYSYRVWQVSMRLMAGLALLIVAPIFTAIWLVNLFGDRGPLFFKQQRRGYNGIPFEIFKLRTMRVGSEKQTALGTLNDHPQVTRLGRTLRTLKIDELPQLLNIARGDMSFVGPRPIPMSLDVELSKHIYGFQARYATLPGLTSIGQICIKDNALDDQLVADWKLRFEGELHYIRNQSISYDLLMVAMTAAYITKKLRRSQPRSK